MSGALCVASGERVAEEVRRAGALGTVVAGVTVGVLAAGWRRKTSSVKICQLLHPNYTTLISTMCTKVYKIV